MTIAGWTLIVVGGVLIFFSTRYLLSGIPRTARREVEGNDAPCPELGIRAAIIGLIPGFAVIGLAAGIVFLLFGISFLGT
jgi:hypothetical protein